MGFGQFRSLSFVESLYKFSVFICASTNKLLDQHSTREIVWIKPYIYPHCLFFLCSWNCVLSFLLVSLSIGLFLITSVLSWFLFLFGWNGCELTMSHLNWSILNEDFLHDWPTMMVQLQPIFECYRKKIVFFATTRMLMPGLFLLYIYNT